jgi:hypothetical protein
MDNISIWGMEMGMSGAGDSEFMTVGLFDDAVGERPNCPAGMLFAVSCSCLCCISELCLPAAAMLPQVAALRATSPVVLSPQNFVSPIEVGRKLVPPPQAAATNQPMAEATRGAFSHKAGDKRQRAGVPVATSVPFHAGVARAFCTETTGVSTGDGERFRVGF